MPSIEQIALATLVAPICHEANRRYCESIGDTSQVCWYLAPDWQKQSAINGVLFHMNKPNAGPEGSHENWVREKAEAGWVYGEIKDPNAKTHPCMVPYESLPEQQRIKDRLFVAIVRAFVN